MTEQLECLEAWLNVWINIKATQARENILNKIRAAEKTHFNAQHHKIAYLCNT